MYCGRCGKEIRVGAVFCPYCGEKQNTGGAGSNVTENGVGDLKKKCVKMSEREKPEDFELDSGINWPQFDAMTAEEKEAYYQEHPFPYSNLDEYTAAVRRWILWTYEKDSEEYVDHCIEKNMRWISRGFREKTPIDLVAVDIMYCCG